MPEDEQLYTNVRGTIMNKNTIEEFKSIDKAALLSTVGKNIWAELKDKTWITKPSTLLNFVILSFAVSWSLICLYEYFLFFTTNNNLNILSYLSQTFIKIYLNNECIWIIKYIYFYFRILRNSITTIGLHSQHPCSRQFM